MEQEGKDAEQEEEVIPSSQGEMFSSQSSTPDLLSPAHLIPILQPSQSLSGNEMGTPQHPRSAELLASTPSALRPDADSSPAEVRLDVSAAHSEAWLDLSETPSEVRLDLSATPSEPGPERPAGPLKRPRSADAAVPTPEKRARTAAAGADDSDIQFVEEVAPDVQVVFNSQAAESAPLSSAAESQADLRLCLSPSQSEEVSQLPAAPPAGSPAPAEASAEQTSEPPGPSCPSADTPSDGGAAPAAGGAPGRVRTPPAAGGSGSSGPAVRPPEESPASSDSQGFQPATEPGCDAAGVRLPHIQTPQVGSSDSVSPDGDTVFGQAQRLIEEQNRQQQLRAADPEGPSSTAAAGQRETPAAVTLESTEPSPAAAEGEKPPSTANSENPSSGAMEDDSRSSAVDKSSIVVDRENPPAATGEGGSAPSAREAGEQPPPAAEAGEKQEREGEPVPATEEEPVPAAAVAEGALSQPAADGLRPEDTAESAERELGEDPLPAASDPFRFHGTQSQETQPYRLRPVIKNILAEKKRLTEEGYSLAELTWSWSWRKGDQEVKQTFPLDEHDGAELLRRMASSQLLSSTSSSSLRSTSTCGGHAADVSSKSSGDSNSSCNKRQSTLTSVTLSTIDGRGGRLSVSSSLDALPLAGRRSVMSVQPCSPGSDGEPAAVSSLRTDLEESVGSQLPPGLVSPPAATSTQAERSAASQSSSASHVTGSTPSPEVALQPALPVRPLTDQEEEQLSEHEQSELAHRTLEPDMPCFGLWADRTYYPGRLVSEARADRWLVRFDDGSERHVPADHVLPVTNLWKGLSVFVQNQRNVYEAGLITGHRMSSGAEPLEYIVSLDSQPSVMSAVPRSWLSLTMDQAALVRERRQPSLGQLAVGSPSRHLSLDNLVTGRRRAAGPAGGRRLANFETSASDAAADTASGDTSRTRRAGSKSSLSRRKKGAAKKAVTIAPGPATDLSAAAEPAGAAEAGAATTNGDSSGAPEDAEPAPEAGTAAPARRTPAKGKRARLQRGSKADRSGGGSPAAGSPSTPGPSAAGSAAKSPTASGRRGSRQRAASTPSTSTATAGGAEVASTSATPSGRKKRVTASTPTEEAAAAAATPSGRARKRATTSTPTDEAAAASAAATATPSGRKKRATTSEQKAAGAAAKRASGSAQKASQPIATPVSRSGRGRKRAGAASPASEEPSPPGEQPAGPAVAATAGRRSRKRLALSPSAETSATESSHTEEGAPPVRPLGDLPDAPSSLFAKHTFILTNGGAAHGDAYRKRMKRKLRPPFDKEHVTEHIEARCGRVLSDTTLTPEALERVRAQGDLLLLANGPVRTPKYISCLAMGVPCVLYTWLEDSIRRNECQAYEDYLLPAGFDPATGEELDQLLGLAGPPPLAGLCVLLAAADDSEWGHMMADVLAAAGARVKLEHQDPAAAALPFAPDVVVAEADCPAPVLGWARLCETPVVSGEWVVGCVVAHRRLDYRARPEFDHSVRPATG
ncbi:streptococcal hemagglutinin-like [Amphibalanus amphitrite]|uniref:streptococcal hemagglutinin-like n=1 Tax=Amphibalanus amphitrite TaxID=1232801 RepID=UPI001C909502|nr:streptococcal hemagglutinin-like [Amphibalanus amphitrite]